MADGADAFFLDTSIQISRQWEDEKIRRYLNKELSQKPCYCSVYVKNEYKLNILNDTILVHTITVDSGTLDEAKSRLDALMKEMGRRPDELPYKIFRRLFNEYRRKAPFLRKLEKLIEQEWLNFFLGNIKKSLFNLVQCNSAQYEPYKKGDHYFGITSKCSPGCEIEEFLKSHQTSLSLLSKMGNVTLDKMNDPKDTLKDIKAASTAILKGAPPQGKHCREMSDAVISIEAKASDPTIILHSMDADFKLLGKVLNIPTRVHSKHKIANSQ
jgi:hypothetical protein